MKTLICSAGTLLLFLSAAGLAQVSTQPSESADRAADTALDQADAPKGDLESRERAADRAKRDMDRSERDLDRERSDRDLRGDSQRERRERSDRDLGERDTRRELRDRADRMSERERDRDSTWSSESDRDWNRDRFESHSGCIEGGAVYGFGGTYTYGFNYDNLTYDEGPARSADNPGFVPYGPSGTGYAISSDLDEPAERRERMSEQARGEREGRFGQRQSEGEIVAMRSETVRGERHTIVRVRLDDGAIENIDLGPANALRSVDLREGDQIGFTAQRGRIDGRERLMASQIKVNGRTIDIDQGPEMRLRGQPVSPRERRLERDRPGSQRDERELNRDRDRDMEEQYEPRERELQDELAPEDIEESESGSDSGGSKRANPKMQGSDAGAHQGASVGPKNEGEDSTDR